MVTETTPGGGPRFWITLVMVGAVGFLLCANWIAGAPLSGKPFIRFQPPWLGSVINVLAPMMLVALIPFVLVKGPPNRLWRIFVPLLPVATLAGFLAMIAVLDLLQVVARGYSAALEPLVRVELTDSRAVLYRTNGGATSSFGMRLREERRLIPGVWLVRNVRTWYPAWNGEMEELGPGLLRVRVEGVNHEFEFGSGIQRQK